MNQRSLRTQDRATLMLTVSEALYAIRPRPMSEASLWNLVCANGPAREDDFRYALATLRRHGAFRDTNGDWKYCGYFA